MDNDMNSEQTISSGVKRHWIASLFFVTILSAYLIGELVLKFDSTVQHILLTLTAVMGIHMLDRFFLFKDIENNISQQTQKLIETSKSLESMKHCGIVQIYTSRVDAAADIKRDLLDSRNTEICIMGVSLNDFIQDIDHNLHDIWVTIQKYVTGEERKSCDGSKKLNIKFLIIDPLCFGATLRSGSESAYSLALALRLKTDVMGAAEDLKKLEDNLNNKKLRIEFECRLYRLPPILFLCWTDNTSYVHQYHFWSSRDNRTPIPTFKYTKLSESGNNYLYHQQLKNHFDWIWKHASISVSEFLDEHTVGIDDGAHKTGIVNIYTDPVKASYRIKYLLDHAKESINIQGVSLKSYFKLGSGSLRESLTNLIADGNVKINILMLNPDSEQAMYRSYRESLFENALQTYDEYLSGGKHKESDLYRDTNQTIKQIKHIIDDILIDKCKNSKEEWKPNLEVAFYDTAPACFILMIDKHVLIEQYHYGKAALGIKDILGKDMPLVEYSEEADDLYNKDSDKERNRIRMPYALLKDHLDFVKMQAKIQDIGITPTTKKNQVDTESEGIHSGKRRAKLTRALGKRSLKSDHPRLFNPRHFAGESWSVKNGYHCRNSKTAFC